MESRKIGSGFGKLFEVSMEKKSMTTRVENTQRPKRLAVATMLVGIASLLVAFLLLTDRAEMPMVHIQPYTIILLVLGLLLVLATLVVGVLALVQTIKSKSPYLWMAAAGLVLGLLASVVIVMAAIVVSFKLPW
jgi:hypothetical protein